MATIVESDGSGRIVIPKKIRDEFGIVGRTQFLLTHNKKGQILLQKIDVDEIARRRRRPASPGPEDPADILQLIHEAGDAPDSALARADDASRIQKALSALPVEQREVVFLRHFEGMSYAAIAEVLGIPAGTVMSRLYHGRRNLGEKLSSS